MPDLLGRDGQAGMPDLLGSRLIESNYVEGGDGMLAWHAWTFPVSIEAGVHWALTTLRLAFPGAP